MKNCFIDTASRAVKIAGVTPHPDNRWMMQIARNAFAERFVRSVKEERLSRMIFFGHASLQHAIRHFMPRYHTERNHQGVGNRLLQPGLATGLSRHCVRRRQRLGGMLNYYHRSAA